jgi:hypothetical protein
MSKSQQSHWHCSNRSCGWSAILTLSDEQDVAPLCVCGGYMKRTEMPSLSYLDFLQDDTDVENFPLEASRGVE